MTMTRWCRHVIGQGGLLLLLASVSMGAGRTVPLIEAAKQGDAAALTALLRRGEDANTPAADGSTALHWAAHREDLKAVEALLWAGANAKAVTRLGITPLMLASENGNAAILERLLKDGADPNTATAGGETPLMTAVRTAKVDAVKVLLAHGANVNAHESARGQTALMWAATEGRVSVVKLLLEAGAEIQARSSSPPPMAAMDADVGSPDMEPPAEGAFGSMTALLLAARRGQLEVVRTLLDAGANVNDETMVNPRRGMVNAVTLAIANAHYEVAALLLDKGVDPNHAGQGWSAMHQLAWARSEPGKTRTSVGWTPGPAMTGMVSGLELAGKLVAKGADVNARITREMRNGYAVQLSRVGATPFFLAARAGDAPLARVLAARGADPNISTKDGVMPLMVAAGVYQKNGEDTPSLEDALDTVKLCIELGVDVNAADPKGLTALHGAARFGADDVVQYLADHGATLDQRTAPSKDEPRGVTALGVAYGKKISGGVFIRQLQTAALLVTLMKERGLPIEDDPQDGLKDGAYSEKRP